MSDDKQSTLRRNIAAAINSASAENGSNTPDFILAEYLADCLAAFDRATKQREGWYSIESAPGRGTTHLEVKP